MRTFLVLILIHLVAFGVEAMRQNRVGLTKYFGARVFLPYATFPKQQEHEHICKKRDVDPCNYLR